MDARPLTPREKKLGLFLLAILALLAYTIKDKPKPKDALALAQAYDKETTQEDPVDTKGQEIYVHITGAIGKPGLYKLEGPVRLMDVVTKAGGFLPTADTDKLNLAAIVDDQARIDVPVKGQVEEDEASNAKVNINKASLEELKALPGIGDKTAQKILDRVKNEGPFQKEEDLMDLPGIGEKKYQELEAYISVY